MALTDYPFASDPQARELERRRIISRLIAAEFGSSRGPEGDDPVSAPVDWPEVLGEPVDPVILAAAAKLRKGRPCKRAVPFKSVFDR